MEESVTQLKLELKKWEKEFQKENGRKPTKDDISAADDTVQEKYKKFNNHRRSLKGVDVWGSELNKKNLEEKEASKIKSSEKVTSKLGQKLWENSRMLPPGNSSLNSSKRFSLPSTCDKNDGKVRVDTPRPTTTMSRLNPFTPSLPATTSSPSLKPNPKSLLGDNSDFIITPQKGSMLEKALNISQSNPRRTGLNSPKDNSNAFSPVMKKPLRSSIPKISSDFLSQMEEDIQTSIEIELENSAAHSFSKSFKSCTPNKRAANKEDIIMKSPIREEGNAEKINSKENCDSGDDNYEPFPHEESIRDFSKSPTIDSEKTRGLKRKAESSESGASSFSLMPSEANLLSGGGEEGMDDGQTQKKLKFDTEERPLVSRGSIITDGNRIGPAPAVKSAHKASKDNQESAEDSDGNEKTVSKAKKTKSSKFAATKSTGGGGGGGGRTISSQNFVRLNMKTKSYRRRGAGRTGSQMKRLQWKQKMAARSQSRGDKCFKCGGEGHWAKYCKGKRKVTNAPEVEEDDNFDPENFPTFGDALKMAYGVETKDKTENKKTKTPTTKAAADDDAGSTEKKQDKEEELGREEEEWAELEMVRQRRADVEVTVAPPSGMDPLYHLNPDGTLPETPKAVYDALKLFGYSSFRPGQEAAVLRMLCGETTLVQLATGSGKSLCYQLPAYMYAQRSPSLTLVISPLVSLMEDQVSGLPPGIHGACLHTNMPKPQREKVIQALEEGKVHFLLLSPEALVGTGHGMLNFNKLPPIAFACIDEAHCVSAWSHHFRPSYLRVCKVLRERLGVTCLLGLTATATRATALNVAQHLGVRDGEHAFIRGKAIPDNLILSVSKDDDRDMALLQLLQGERFSSCHSIIVYCTRRDTTERLATLIRTNLKQIEHPTKINPNAPKSKSKKVIQVAEAYHAGLSAAARKRVQLNFMNGSLRLVVATVAFGMGLDKQDVHGIIHYNMPRNFESYVQETGRAGRDGNTSHCHVFLSQSSSDLSELKRHIFANTVDRVSVKKLIKRVFRPCQCTELHQMFNEDMEGEGEGGESVEPPCPWHERAIPIDGVVKELDMKEEGICTLLCYLELDKDRKMEIRNSIYSTCTITSYNGLRGLQTAAQKCPALAVAIAKCKGRGVKVDGRELSFSVVEVADSMGTQSGLVKRELSSLKWIKTATGGYDRSPLMLEFSDLAFLVTSVGTLTDDQLDVMVDKVHGRIVEQEENELEHLHYFYNVLHSVAHRDHFMCSDQADIDRSDRLKGKIRQYFDFNQHHLPVDDNLKHLEHVEQPSYSDEAIGCDTRQFIHLYADDHPITARAIARIYHGIPSPNFPADVWGRVRRFWRAHLNVPFNHLLSLCKSTIINMK